MCVWVGGDQVTSGALCFLLQRGGQGVCKEGSLSRGAQEGFPLGRDVLRTQRESSSPVVGKSGLFLGLWETVAEKRPEAKMQ